MRELAPGQLARWLSDPARTNPVLLDVREPWEIDICRIGDPVLIPMASIPARVAELDRESHIVVICHHGGRSRQVALFLEQSGYPKVYNLAGGVDGWARHVDPAMPTY